MGDRTVRSIIIVMERRFLLLLLLLGLFNVGLSVPPRSSTRASRHITDLIVRYFRDGYSYRLILTWLGLVHGISISLATLKRVLRRLGLKRRLKPNMEHFRIVEALMRVS